MPTIYDPDKPESGTRFVSADVRDNFNALSRANDLRPSEQAAPDLTILVQGGQFVLDASSSFAFPGGSSPALDTTTGGLAGQERYVILQITDTATLVFKEGAWASAGNAVVPNFDIDKVALAQILHTYDQSTLTEDDIVDIRPFVTLSSGVGPRIDPGIATITATDALGPGLGQTDFDLTPFFEYKINEDEILVFVDGVYQTSLLDYTEPDVVTVRFNTAIPAGSLVSIWRVGISAAPGAVNFVDLNDISANQSTAFHAADAPTAINPFLTVSGHDALDHSTIAPIATMLTDITVLQGHVTALAGAHAATAISVVDNLDFAAPTNVQEGIDAIQTFRDDYIAEHKTDGTHGPRVTIDQTDGGSALSVLDITNAGTGSSIYVSTTGVADGLTIDNGQGNALVISSPQGSGNAILATTSNTSFVGETIHAKNSGTGHALRISQDNVAGGGSPILITNSGTGNGINIAQDGNGRGLVVVQQAGSSLTAFFNKIGGTNNCVEISNTGTGSDLRGTSGNWSVAPNGNGDFNGISFQGLNASKTLWGSVTGGGVISNTGSGGWSVVRTGIGKYTITFAPGFALAPVIQGTAIVPVPATVQQQAFATTTTATIGTWQDGAGYIDMDWSFVAIGRV